MKPKATKREIAAVARYHRAIDSAHREAMDRLASGDPSIHVISDLRAAYRTAWKAAPQSVLLGTEKY